VKLVGVAAVNAEKTRCRRGHKFDGFKNGKRICRTCDRAKAREYRRRASRVRPLPPRTHDELSKVRIPYQPLADWFVKHNISPRQEFHPSIYRQIERCRARGYISMGYADELSCLLSLHPCQVWGDDWFSYGETA
jgi:hypothetical protein